MQVENACQNLQHLSSLIVKHVSSDFIFIFLGAPAHGHPDGPQTP